MFPFLVGTGMNLEATEKDGLQFALLQSVRENRLQDRCWFI